ncbi:hypothetical protein ZWY2020_059788, partial [Hordeum vulgare]
GVLARRPSAAAARLLVAVVALVTCTICLWSSSTDLTLASYKAQVPPPPESETNGYLRVRCNGGLNQQRTAICNAVVAARIMNATLVLPELDTNSFWRDESGFIGIYDVPHFIKTLKYDVHIAMSCPDIITNGKTKKLKAYQIRPPRDAPVTWYMTVALEKMKSYGAIYLTPFSHRLAEDINDPEIQRLRCRVNYHALRFKPNIMKTSSEIVNKSTRRPFHVDSSSYRKENFAEKNLSIGKDGSLKVPFNSRRALWWETLYEALQDYVSRPENHSSAGPGKLEENTCGLAGSAVDYMVCLLSDIFMPTYDGPSNFANNLIGHRLYYGFRIHHHAKQEGPCSHIHGQGDMVPHKRIHPESFYTNSWPECFCQANPRNRADKCPPDNIHEVLENQFRSEGSIEVKATSQIDSTSETEETLI